MLVGVMLALAMACNEEAPASEVTRLDTQLLAAVSERLGWFALFSGHQLSPLDIAALQRESRPALRPRSPAAADAEQRRLIGLGRRVQHLIRSMPNTPPNLRIRALWTLIADPGAAGCDQAVGLLQTALTAQPSSAERQNDLAAALLLRAGSGQPEDLALALELLDPIVANRQPLPQALFNRVRVLRILTLWDAAHATARRLPGRWPESLTATRSRAAMGAPTRSNDPLVLRHRGEWLLGEWAVLRLKNSKASADCLRQAGEIGSYLQATSGDGLLNAAVAVVELSERSDPARLRLLTKGHADFHAIRGTALYSQCRPAMLASAEAALAAAASPFAGWVQLDRAICAYFDRDLGRAEVILTALRAKAATHGFLALQGRAEWILGIVRMLQARFVEADRDYSIAVHLFHRLGEEAHVVSLGSLRAKNYDYGGAIAEGWSQRLSALANRRFLSDPERLYNLFEEAAEAMRRRHYFAAALDFISEQMRAAEMGLQQTGGADLLAFTLVARASLLTTLHRSAEASRDLARAQDVWSRLSPRNESWRRLRVDLDLQLYAASGVEPGEAAVAAVDRGIAFFSGSAHSLGDQIEILRLRELRAMVHEHRGQIADARDDLRRGVSEVDRQALEVADMEDRARFLAARRSLVLDLLQLELARFHDPASALEILERNSNRILSDTSRSYGVGEEPPPPGRWAKVLAATLPPGTLVLRYAHLAERVLVWSFDDGLMVLESRDISDTELRSRVERCRSSLSRGAFQKREDACDELAGIILPRRLLTLTAGRPVLIVGDELVAAVPFAALRPYPGAPYLVELHCLSYSPSLLAWLAAAPPAPRPKPRAALFIADPDFSSVLFPELSRLPAARSATQDYAANYARVEVLAGREATKAAVLGALSRFEVLQFDGHSIANSQVPEQGGLLLTPAERGATELASSLLTAADLPQRALRHLRLVVLGGCSTGLTSYRNTEEVTGLAAAFLGRGVQAVVATAWAVSDSGSALLLGRFHRELTAGKRPEEALQIAQLSLLRSNRGESDGLRTWPAFQVFRGP
jgi:CHAT domain-containing protein